MYNQTSSGKTICRTPPMCAFKAICRTPPTCAFKQVHIIVIILHIILSKG
ncbi:hypothetical protein Hanom_Chr07g00673281 [Helianthus anomalus]